MINRKNLINKVDDQKAVENFKKTTDFTQRQSFI